jgi:hypothetical protein
MSKKADILLLLSEGKDYDEIEKAVPGSKRSYIRSLASNYRKNAAKTTLSEQTEEQEETPEIDEESGTMDFVNDIDNEGHNMTDELKNKTGMQYHKEWVKEKAYECSCGCTLNRKATFCPHCGVPLDWEGI